MGAGKGDRGKRVLITGSGRGIGKGIAAKFASQGARLFLCARSEAELVATASELRAAATEVRTRAIDLNRSDAGESLIDEVVKAWDGLDVLVTNAGAASQGGFLELPNEAWLEGFGLKMFGNLRVVKAAWPYLAAAGGSLVMIGGGTARVPDQRLSLVSAINGGLASLSKSIAEQGYFDGVQVNLVQPGTIRTSRREKLFQKFGEADGISAAAYAGTLTDRLRIARLGEPSDVAAVVAFLCSREAHWVHGAIIDVDGGQNKAV